MPKPRTPKAAKAAAKRKPRTPKPAETAPSWIKATAAPIEKAEKEQTKATKRKAVADRAEGKAHSIDRAKASRTPPPVDASFVRDLKPDEAMAALAKIYGVKWKAPPPPKPKAAATPARGRPSDYTEELAEYILGEMACGRTVSTICAQGVAEITGADGALKVLHLPSDRTVRRWAINNAHFRPLYAHARELQAHAWFEQTIDIADDGSRDYGPEDEETGFRPVDHDHIQRSKLRVDTRKWATGKLLPREYGDRVKVDLPKDPLEEKTDAQLVNYIGELVTKLRGLGVPLDGISIPGIVATGGGNPGAENGTGPGAG